MPYKCALNISELISLADVMDELQLGPNGGLVYCMDYLQQNMDWLKEKLEPLAREHYLIFDLPGQVELFMMHDSLRQIILEMNNKWDYRLTVVHLVDSHLCTEPSKYIAALLLSLSCMLHLEMPHVNVLSKIDIIEQYGELAFNLDFYTDVLDLGYLMEHFDANPYLSKKYRKLSAGLCELVEDFSLVSFTPLNIEDKESVQALVALVDKSNGYVFSGLHAHTKAGDYPPEFSYTATNTQSEYERVMDVQDKYC
eukprot:CAMPEP_0198213160 /NCGR_PEP_ID=MMETSP1445-20131203/28707_1 /TAXON_ID=36898 /ORGANISM="Pyramimonas sp., Strain CCMP2087" /LENGTH=253 /DNA_ID=CAMNT_0043887771 /DNA_START=434 /DNA_END=1195 /DNA_ORIENTATION=+